MRIGLTGGIGAGKSIVSKVLMSLNYPVFNSDLEAKLILTSSAEVRKEIATYFGSEAYINGELNKKLIAKRIFSDDKARLKINSIIHPRVRKAFDDFARKYNNFLVFNEAAIIFETNRESAFDKTILVTAPLELKISRIIARDKMSKKDVLARMNKQWTDEQKIPLADFIIENDEKQALLPQLMEVLKQLNHSISV